MAGLYDPKLGNFYDAVGMTQDATQAELLAACTRLRQVPGKAEVAMRADFVFADPVNRAIYNAELAEIEALEAAVAAEAFEGRRRFRRMRRLSLAARQPGVKAVETPPGKAEVPYMQAYLANLPKSQWRQWRPWRTTAGCVVCIMVVLVIIFAIALFQAGYTTGDDASPAPAGQAAPTAASPVRSKTAAPAPAYGPVAAGQANPCEYPSANRWLKLLNPARKSWKPPAAYWTYDGARDAKPLMVYHLGSNTIELSSQLTPTGMVVTDIHGHDHLYNLDKTARRLRAPFSDPDTPGLTLTSLVVCGNI